jgi:hypothetical protein
MVNQWLPRRAPISRGRSPIQLPKDIDQQHQTAVTSEMMTPAATQWSPSPAPDISSAPAMIDKGQAGEHIHDQANVLPRQRKAPAGASQVPISMKRINQAARAR